MLGNFAGTAQTQSSNEKEHLKGRLALVFKKKQKTKKMMHSLHRFVRRVGEQTFKRGTFRLPRCTRICKAPTFFPERGSGNLNIKTCLIIKRNQSFCCVCATSRGFFFANSLQPRSCSAQISPLADVHGCVFNQASEFHGMPTSFVYG